MSAKVVITVENGMVTGVYTDVAGLDVEVVDWDDHYKGTYKKNKKRMTEVESAMTKVY